MNGVPFPPEKSETAMTALIPHGNVIAALAQLQTAVLESCNSLMPEHTLLYPVSPFFCALETYRIEADAPADRLAAWRKSFSAHRDSAANAGQTDSCAQVEISAPVFQNGAVFCPVSVRLPNTASPGKNSGNTAHNTSDDDAAAPGKPGSDPGQYALQLAFAAHTDNRTAPDTLTDADTAGIHRTLKNVCKAHTFPDTMTLRVFRLASMSLSDTSGATGSRFSWDWQIHKEVWVKLKNSREPRIRQNPDGI